jgi:hypothetical protein
MKTKLTDKSITGTTSNNQNAILEKNKKNSKTHEKILKNKHTNKLSIPKSYSKHESEPDSTSPEVKNVEFVVSRYNKKSDEKKEKNELSEQTDEYSSCNIMQSLIRKSVNEHSLEKNFKM